MNEPKEVAFTITPRLFVEALGKTEKEPRPKFETFDSSNAHFVVTTWRAAARGICRKIGHPYFRIHHIKVHRDRSSVARYDANAYRRRMNRTSPGGAS